MADFKYTPGKPKLTKDELAYQHNEIHEWLKMWGRLLVFLLIAQLILAVMGKWDGVFLFGGGVIIVCLIRIHLMFKHDFLLMENKEHFDGEQR